MSRLQDYENKYRNIRFERRDGILQATLHTEGGPLQWGSDPGCVHGQIGAACFEIAHDPENRVLILTGSGDRFCTELNHAEIKDPPGATSWARIISEGKDLLMQLLDIEVPVIGIVNGPATIHAEIPLLSDIVLAADDAVIGDAAHLPGGVVPGDGVHVVWPHLLGPNAGRYFLYAEQQLSAQEAQRLGVVGEVMPRAQLLPRAWALAEKLVRKPPLTLRYTRTLLTQPLKKKLLDDLGYGLSLEGLGICAMLEAHRPGA